jgi:hypothetical protein
VSGCNPGVQMGVIWCSCASFDIAWICVAGAVNFPAASRSLLGSSPKKLPKTARALSGGSRQRKKNVNWAPNKNCRKLLKTALVQEVRVHQPRLAARLASTWHGSAWGWIWCATLTSPGCDWLTTVPSPGTTEELWAEWNGQDFGVFAPEKLIK